MRNLLFFPALLSLVSLAHAAEQAPYNSSTISGLGARNIGSATMSGRVSAFAADHDPSGKITLFVGAASGGVWKSDDGGTTYKPVFDEQPVQSIGAIALDPKNSKNVWVGTGEPWTRNSVSIGNGMYRSTDAGETWTRAGLPTSERISQIVVSPENGETVYVAVPGPLWSDSPDRGLYKTTDGGRTWTQILKGGNLSTGCSTIAMDPSNPQVLLAGMWDFRRKGWTFRSGGDGPNAPSASALFRSADGGATWSEVTPENSKGFPKKPYGRLALAFAPSNAQRVYCFVESTDSALFVSDDGGATWDKRDKSNWMVWRPFYFANLVVDPKNPDRVFKTDGALIMSEDAGKSFATVGGFQGGHGDVHAVWIDPTNPQTVFLGDDGGMWYSHNGGSKWWKADNLPISQFYHVSVDDADPYRVYGGLQDNSSWVGQSQYPGGINNAQWENMYGGDGFWSFSDPSDPDYLYAEAQGGTIGRVNRHTLQGRDIQPKPNYKEKLRWNWNTPIALSPNEKGTIYMGAQFLFRSRNQGQTWDRISPDLTTNDPEKQKQEQSGGVTIDNSAAEMHTTIYSISESPKDKNVIWAGTDDGNLQLTRDGGKTWTNVVGNVPGLPKNSWVSWVEAGNFEPGTAHVTFDRHTFGEMTAYVYRTTDFGKTWTPLVTPQELSGVQGYAHVIKEDTVKPNILFLGTEFGLYVSIDTGKTWAQFKGGRFPAVAVRDLAIQARDNELVLATHGRGIWIVDDITPLRALTPELLGQEAAFVAAKPVQQRIQGNGGWANGAAVFTGDNPPDAAVITYYQRTRHLFGKLKIEVLDASGRVVDELPASKRPGLNRVMWSMREKPPRVPPAAQLAFAGTRGPRVLPGVYTVRMTKDGKVSETKLTVGLDRRAKFTAADRKAQYDAAMRVHALFGAESALMDRILPLRAALAKAGRGLSESDPLRKTLSDFDGKVDAVRKQIVATTEGGAITGEERLREHTDQLYGAILSFEGKPGDYQVANIDALKRELDDVTKEFEQLNTKDLPAVNDALKAKGQPAIAFTPESSTAVGMFARFLDPAVERAAATD
ncbi:MAG: sialidase [Chthoniobacterales bacterium]